MKPVDSKKEAEEEEEEDTGDQEKKKKKSNKGETGKPVQGWEAAGRAGQAEGGAGQDSSESEGQRL